jgi:hypothetical protein
MIISKNYEDVKINMADATGQAKQVPGQHDFRIGLFSGFGGIC